MQTTTLKHLYKAAAERSTKQYRAAIYALIQQKHNLSIDYVLNAPPSELIAFLRERADDGFGFELMSMNTLQLWREYGCQTFALCESVVDLLACTKAPDLSELVTTSVEGLTDKAVVDMTSLKTPYPAFAVELPYPTSVSMQGITEQFRVAVCAPFANIDDRGAPGWSVTYRTPEDVATDRMSTANGSSALGGLLTNLCVYLAEGGRTKKASKRIGYDKVAKKTKSKVNIWNIAKAASTELPLGIAKPFLSSGEVPPKHFRIGKRFMVRGHWRNQVCGEGRTHRKKIWIMPHIKGPEEGEAFSRVYQVSKGEVS